MPFLVTLLASVAIHAGTNLANDYYDHVRGVDTSESPGPSGVIQQGLLSARHVLTASISAFAFGGLLGLYLMTIRGWIVLLLGVLAVPYLCFHLMLQETATTRYALPLIPAMARRLREDGIPLPTGILSVDQFVDAVSALRPGQTARTNPDGVH